MRSAAIGELLTLTKSVKKHMVYWASLRDIGATSPLCKTAAKQMHTKLHVVAKAEENCKMLIDLADRIDKKYRKTKIMF